MHTIPHSVHCANVLHVPYQSTHVQYNVRMHSTTYACAVQRTHAQYNVRMHSTTYALQYNVSIVTAYMVQ